MPVAENLQYAIHIVPGDWLAVERGFNRLLSQIIPGLVSGGDWYFGPPDGAGVYPEGTWRVTQVGNNLEVQVILSSVWTPAFKFERPV